MPQKAFFRQSGAFSLSINIFSYPIPLNALKTPYFKFSIFSMALTIISVQALLPSSLKSKFICFLRFFFVYWSYETVRNKF